MSEPNRHLQYCTDAAPAQGCVVLTGSAMTLSPRGRGLVVTATGDIVITMEDGSSLTWTSIPVGVYAFTVRTVTSSSCSGYVLI